MQRVFEVFIINSFAPFGLCLWIQVFLPPFWVTDVLFGEK